MNRVAHASGMALLPMAVAVLGGPAVLPYMAITVPVGAAMLVSIPIEYMSRLFIDGTYCQQRLMGKYKRRIQHIVANSRGVADWRGLILHVWTEHGMDLQNKHKKMSPCRGIQDCPALKPNARWGFSDTQAMLTRLGYTPLTHLEEPHSQQNSV